MENNLKTQSAYQSFSDLLDIARRNNAETSILRNNVLEIYVDNVLDLHLF